MLKKCKIEIYCTSYEYSVLVVFQFISVTEEFQTKDFLTRHI